MNKLTSSQARSVTARRFIWRNIRSKQSKFSLFFSDVCLLELFFSFKCEISDWWVGALSVFPMMIYGLTYAKQSKLVDAHELKHSVYCLLLININRRKRFDARRLFSLNFYYHRVAHTFSSCRINADHFTFCSCSFTQLSIPNGFWHFKA